jgi:hypothetical protein
MQVKKGLFSALEFRFLQLDGFGPSPTRAGDKPFLFCEGRTKQNGK